MKSILSIAIAVGLCFASSTYSTITNHTEIHSSITPELIENTAKAIDNLSSAATTIAITLKETTPYLIKVGTINLAGLICSCSGIYVLVKGIQQSCAAHKEENNDYNEHTSFLKRCMNTLTNSSAKGTYQSGAGLVIFLLGLSSIASSERILALCA